MDNVALFIPVHYKDERYIKSLQKFICIVIKRAVSAIKEKKPLPRSFIDLFGNCTINQDEKVIDLVEKITKKSKGGAFQDSQLVFQNFISEIYGHVDKASLKEINGSIFFDIPSVISINLKELLEQEDILRGEVNVA